MQKQKLWNCRKNQLLPHSYSTGMDTREGERDQIFFFFHRTPPGLLLKRKKRKRKEKKKRKEKEREKKKKEKRKRGRKRKIDKKEKRKQGI